MARKKKNDFWDNVDDEKVITYDSPEGGEAAEVYEDEWSVFKSTPIKVIMRILLMASALACLLAGYVAFQYIRDRYAGGSYSSEFSDSASYVSQYNQSVNQLALFIEAMEADSELTSEGNEELLTTMVENHMGKDTNFSFIIQDKDHFSIVSSGEDAKDRIEASTHYALISNTGSELSVQSSLRNDLLDQEGWEEKLSGLNGKYIIYTAVDDQLTYQDSFYNAQRSFEKMGDYFNLAKTAGIIALIILVISLIFCIVATGQVRGYEGVYLTAFDRVFTELSVLIMGVVSCGLIYGIYRLMGREGNIYRLASIALVVLCYGWVARSYFSIVRRIKAGRLFRCSIAGGIVKGVNLTVGRLPYPLNAIIQGLLLIAVNCAVVYLAVFKSEFTFRGIRLTYVLAAIFAVIEVAGLLSYAAGGSHEEVDEDEEEEREELTSSMEELKDQIESDKSREEQQSSAMTAQVSPELDMEEEQDWETMDLSKVIASAEQEKKASMESGVDGRIYSSDEDAIEKARRTHDTGAATQVLSDEEIERAIRDSEPADDESQAASDPETVEAAEPPEDSSGRVDFVQLNKELRADYRTSLRERGVVVTMRTPDMPVIIDMDKTSLSILISNIFDQIGRLSASDVKNYLEAYVQDGKVVYIARIKVAEDMMDAAQAAISDDSFDAARKIVEANDGRFVASLDGDTLRVGMLMDAA